MGILEFFVGVVVVVLLGALATWVIDYFAPGHPAFIDRLIWGVVILVIVMVLANVTGLLRYDPLIPRFR